MYAQVMLIAGELNGCGLAPLAYENLHQVSYYTPCIRVACMHGMCV